MMYDIYNQHISEISPIDDGIQIIKRHELNLKVDYLNIFASFIKSSSSMVLG